MVHVNSLGGSPLDHRKDGDALRVAAQSLAKKGNLPVVVAVGFARKERHKVMESAKPNWLSLQLPEREVKLDHRYHFVEGASDVKNRYHFEEVEKYQFIEGEKYRYATPGLY